jgi:hypothetical protein
MVFHEWKDQRWYYENIPGTHLLKHPQIIRLNLEFKNGNLTCTAEAMTSSPNLMYNDISRYVEFEKE